MFARTERLLLRPGWIEDAPALARAIGEEAVVRNLATAPWPYKESDARDFLSQPIDPAQPRFLIFARTGGAPAGGAGRTTGAGWLRPCSLIRRDRRELKQQ